MGNKSFWQKIYSALGFWKYYEEDGKNQYKVIYWCCFPPPFPWFRKFDIFKYKVKYNKEYVEMWRKRFCYNKKEKRSQKN